MVMSHGKTISMNQANPHAIPPVVKDDPYLAKMMQISLTYFLHSNK